jgi:amidase
VERTCGGSSGGAAASLAAGLTPLELGSDIGGSIRTPSHFNGVYGHKPSYDLVSPEGHLPPGPGVISTTDLSVIGPLAICAGDLEKALDILAEEELPRPRATEAKNLRVATYFNDALCPVDNEIQAALEDVANALEKAGASVSRNMIPDFTFAENFENYSLLLNAALSASFPPSVIDASRKFLKTVDDDENSKKVLQARGLTMSHAKWLAEEEKRLHIMAKWQAFFQDYDVLLCPPTNLVAFPHDHTSDFHARRLTVNGAEREYLEVLGWAGFRLTPIYQQPSHLRDEQKITMPIGV